MTLVKNLFESALVVTNECNGKLVEASGFVKKDLRSRTGEPWL